MKKKALKILLALLATPLVLFALLAALLYCPPVQQWAVEKAAGYASKTTGMQVSVESVRLSWPLDLDLRGFRAVQANDSTRAMTDTVADVRSLVCSVELRPLFDGLVNVDRLDFHDLRVNTYGLIPSVQIQGRVGRLRVESHGIDIPKSHVNVDDALLSSALLDIALSDTVPEDTTESQNFWVVDVHKLALQQTELALHTPGDTLVIAARMTDAVACNAYLGLHDNVYRVGKLDWHGGFFQMDQTYEKPTTGFDATHLRLSKLHLGIDSLAYDAPTVAVNIRSARFEERSGLTVNDFAGRFLMDSTSIALSNIALKMPATALKGNFRMDLNAFDDHAPGQLATRLDGYTSLADLKPFLTSLPRDIAHILPNNRIAINGALDGNLQTARLHDVAIDWSHLLTLRADGTVSSLTDTDRLTTQLKVKGKLRRLDFIKPLLPKDINALVRLPQNIGYNYNINVRPTRYTLDGMTTVADGALQTKGYYDTRSEAYELSATARRFNAALFLPHQGLHPFTGTVALAGHGTDILGGKSSLALKADIKQFAYQTYNLDNIKATATLAGSQLNAHINSRNRLASGDITARGRLSMKAIDLYLKGLVSHADLYALGATDERYTLATAMDLHVTSDLKKRHTAEGSVNDLDLQQDKAPLFSGTFNLNGEMSGNDILAHMDGDCQLTQSGQEYDLGDFNLDVLSQNDSTHARLAGGDFLLDASAHGGYNSVIDAFSRIGKQIGKQIEQRSLDHTIIREMLPTASLSLHTGQDNIISRFIEQQGFTFRTADIELTSAQETGLNGTATLDSLVYNDSITIDHAHLELVTLGDSLTYRLAVENQTTNDYPYKAYLNGQVLANGLETQATILDDKGKTGLDLSLQALMKGDGINVAITSPRSILGYKEFAVNEGNYVFIGRNQRISAHMRLHAADGAAVQLLSNDEDTTSMQNMTLSMNHFELEKLLSVLPMMPRMSGVLNGDYHITQTADELTVSSDMSIYNMVYEDCPMGNIGTNLVYIPKGDGTHYVDAIISKDDYDVGKLVGTYDPAGKGALDATFQLDKFPLHFVNGFIPDKIIGLRGSGDGTLSVKGPLGHLDINGEVLLDSSYLYSEPYGLQMRFADEPVKISKSRLLFDDFKLYANNDQPLTVNGYYDFSDFDRMTVSMRMQARNFKLIDAKETARSEVYGKAYVNFFGGMTGPVSQLRMGGRLEVLGTTDMTYVMKESAISTDDQLDELVDFVDFSDSTATNIVKPAPQGFQMDMSLSIDEQAHIVCALNESHSNFIDLIGGGDLTMHYDNASSVTLNGRYTLNSGQMKYSLDMIPLKTFNIQEGSYIEFAGDPVNPTLSITATENVRANYSSSGSSDRIVSFNAGVNMTGTLSKPTVEFIIEAPEDMDAQNNLNSMSTEERGKVAVTLLASGMYLADGSPSNYAMNSALASFLQSKINDISGRALSSMGLDLTANMESTADATGALHTDYTFNFSKRLWNNRLTINMGGRVSTGSEATEDNGAYFDSFSMQYRLNKGQTQYLKLYYEREAYDWLEGQVSEFGGGFVWKRKLQRFTDIFRFKTTDDQPIPLAPRDSTHHTPTPIKQ